MPLGLLKVTKWATGGGRQKTEKDVAISMMAESASSQSLLPLSVTTPSTVNNEGGLIDQSSMTIILD